MCSTARESCLQNSLESMKMAWQPSWSEVDTGTDRPSWSVTGVQAPHDATNPVETSDIALRVSIALQTT